MKVPTTQTDRSYAISVLLAAGATVVSLGHDRYRIYPKDSDREFTVEDRALIELAHDQARRRRTDWQTIEDTLQLTLFAYEDTTRYRQEA